MVHAELRAARFRSILRFLLRYLVRATGDGVTGKRSLGAEFRARDSARARGPGWTRPCRSPSWRAAGRRLAVRNPFEGDIGRRSPGWEGQEVEADRMRSRRHIRRHHPHRKLVAAGSPAGCIDSAEGRSLAAAGIDLVVGRSLGLVEGGCIVVMGSCRPEEDREGAVAGRCKAAVGRKAVADRTAAVVDSLVDIGLEVGRNLLAADLCEECSQR